MKKALVGLIGIVMVIAVYLFVVRTQGEVAPTPTPVVGESVTYVSSALGVTFQYVPRTTEQAFSVQESGPRVYVYMADTDPKTGQSVEVFQKRADETFEASVRRQVLANFPSPDCTVVLSRSNIYPGAWVAEIGYPPASSAEEPYWSNYELCNKDYDKANGIRYFLYDDAHPDRFVFLDVGQYAIPGRGNTPWHETLRITGR